MHDVTVSTDGTFEFMHYSWRSEEPVVKHKLRSGYAENIGIFSRVFDGETKRNPGYIIIRKKNSQKELGRLNFCPPKNYEIGKHYIRHVWINGGSNNTFSDTITGYVLYKMNRHRKTDIIKIKKVDKKYRYTNRNVNLENLSQKERALPPYGEPFMSTSQLRAEYSNSRMKYASKRQLGGAS